LVPTLQGAMFQSTPPQGGRPRACSAAATAPLVSIHAPAGGATRGGAGGSVDSREFQSTPPQGGRLSGRQGRRSHSRRFQSTPPQGGRHNGRPCQRRGEPVSIHAPAGGATVVLTAPDMDKWFQSTPPQGGRLGPP